MNFIQPNYKIDFTLAVNNFLKLPEEIENDFKIFSIANEEIKKFENGIMSLIDDLFPSKNEKSFLFY